jgi:hypothetical protein
MVRLREPIHSVIHSVSLCLLYVPSAVVSSGVAKLQFTSEQRCSHQGNGRKCERAVRLENLVSIYCILYK